MKPKYEINKRKMVIDQPKQRSKFEINSKNDSRIRDQILNLLKTNERNLKTLKELNDLLNSELNISSILNSSDSKIDGSFLHYLTLNSQAADELVFFLIKKELI